jgi:Xaa-Pro dipeptidase
MVDIPIDRAALNFPGSTVKDHEPVIDLAKMRRYRLTRARDQLRKHGCDAGVFFDPVNIRYATGSRNMQIYSQHAPDRYLFIPVEGPVVLFDSYALRSGTYPTDIVDELRPASAWHYEVAAHRGPAMAHKWADEIDALVREHCGAGRKLAVDRVHVDGYRELDRLRFNLIDANGPLELARAIKSEEEILCMAVSVAVCEIGIARMREVLRPGISENRLWSELFGTIIGLGGESLETRLLSSGGRTNPWYQECGEKIIRSGDLVAFDTDMIGPYGYCADISRTFLCGPSRATDEQKRLYSLAHEQLQHNLQLLRPGCTLEEVSQKCWKAPDEFIEGRYVCISHGVGLADEYPDVVHPLDWESSGYEGAIEQGMTLCVESYIGAKGGREGVKLEEQVVVRADGPRRLSTFPFEAELLRGT